MKKIFLIITIILTAICSYAQGLTGINYQAVARNLNGTVVNNKPVQIRFTITQGNTATVQYKEIHYTNTNNFGLFNLVIGKGVPLTGNFASIPFANANQWLEVEVSVAGGPMNRLGKSAFNAVPYALMAAAANPVGAAGGDLAGTYPNPKVAKLQGKAVSITAPLAGQALVYNGTTNQWTPSSAIGGSNLWTKAGTTLYNTTLTNNVSIGIVSDQAKLVVSGNGSALFSDDLLGGEFHAALVAVDSSTNTNYEANVGSVSIASNAKNSLNIGAYNRVGPNTDATDKADGYGTISSAVGKGYMTASSNTASTEDAEAYGSFNEASASGKGDVVANDNYASTTGNGDIFGVGSSAYSFSTTGTGAATGITVHTLSKGTGKVTGGNFTVNSGSDATGLISGIQSTVRAANTNNYVQGLQLFTSKTGSSNFDVTGANIQTTNLDNDKPFSVLGVYSVVNAGIISKANATAFNLPANPAGYFESNGGQATYAKVTKGAAFSNNFYKTATAVTGIATTADAANNQSNTGVSGIAGKGSNVNVGVSGSVEYNPTPANGFEAAIYGTNYNTNPNSFAGFFEGNVYADSLQVGANAEVFGNLVVDGDFSVGGMKNFKIDHPLDPQNKTLTHACIESNEVLNMYSGNIVTDGKGFAIVKLPNYFEALNKDFRYQLTVIGSFAQAIVKTEIYNNQFVLQTNQPNIKVSWQVQGVRNDVYMQKNPMKAEQAKEGIAKGKYIYPQGFGMTKAAVKKPNMLTAKKEERVAAINITANKMTMLMEEKELIIPKHKPINKAGKK